MSTGSSFLSQETIEQMEAAFKRIARNHLAATESEKFLEANGMWPINYNKIKEDLKDIEETEKKLAKMKKDLEDYCKQFGGLEKAQEIMRLSDEVQENYIMSDADYEEYKNEGHRK